MVRLVSPVCACGHLQEEHVTTHIKPGGMNSETTGYARRCTQCLCQDFEPKTQDSAEGAGHEIHS